MRIFRLIHEARRREAVELGQFSTSRSQELIGLTARRPHDLLLLVQPGAHDGQIRRHAGVGLACCRREVPRIRTAEDK